ncbi:MAG: DNA double-strand break repair nuclease NurA, partial [Armatimonadetes bacterium]|nr:DNA double-strand break repair nuclease NurA [Armatimonadota bacterium]MDW8123127.1 DNA double-strand break repair nuclease NurA [Armatimonadota bacterium]
MLRLLSIHGQIREFAEGLSREQVDNLQKISHAIEEAQRWKDRLNLLAEKLIVGKTPWLTVIFKEPIDQVYPTPTFPETYLVIASDGSQIVPDRHESLPFYLINIGCAVLPYGLQEKPELTSQPHFFFKPEDLYWQWAGREVPINWELVSLRRQLMEWEALCEIAAQRTHPPSLALVDGTLILWNLEGKPPDIRQGLLARFFKVLDSFQQWGVPIAGYISSPASKEIINTLRVAVCPYDRPDCDGCQWLLRQETPPCAVLERLKDADLFFRLLKPGQRSVVFDSRYPIMSDYGPH